MSTNAPTRPTPPAAAPQYAALRWQPLPTAAPCARCGTRTGCGDRQTGTPLRKRRLCAGCYETERRAGRLAAWPRVLHNNRGHACLGCRRSPATSRGLCSACFSRAKRRGGERQYPACGAVPVPASVNQYGEHFAGVPDDYTPPPTGWPIVPALGALPVPPPVPVIRWATCVGEFEAAWHARERDAEAA